MIVKDKVIFVSIFIYKFQQIYRTSTYSSIFQSARKKCEVERKIILEEYREWIIPEEILFLKILSISRYIFIECIQEIFSSLEPCTSYWPWWKFHGYENQVWSEWALRCPGYPLHVQKGVEFVGSRFVASKESQC